MDSYQEILSRFKIPIALSLVGIVLIIGGYFSSNSNKSSSKEFPKESIVSKTEESFSIDVSGAVKNPGVYKIESSKRVEDAITEAGGFDEKANREYISKYINLAQKLTDGSKIYIPFLGETAPPTNNSTAVSQGNKSVVSINSSSQSELENLPGIGPVTASKIISERPFEKLEELVNKKILNKSTFEKIKEQIVLNN